MLLPRHAVLSKLAGSPAHDRRPGNWRSYLGCSLSAPLLGSCPPSAAWVQRSKGFSVRISFSFSFYALCFGLDCTPSPQSRKLGFIGAAVATSLSNAILASWMVFRTCRALRSELLRSWQGFSRSAFTRWSPFLKLAVPNFLMISEPRLRVHAELFCNLLLLCGAFSDFVLTARARDSRAG